MQGSSPPLQAYHIPTDTYRLLSDTLPESIVDYDYRIQFSPNEQCMAILIIEHNFQDAAILIFDLDDFSLLRREPIEVQLYSMSYRWLPADTDEVAQN